MSLIEINAPKVLLNSTTAKRFVSFVFSNIYRDPKQEFVIYDLFEVVGLPCLEEHLIFKHYWVIQFTNAIDKVLTETCTWVHAD